jgi:hypothetical protein
MDCGQEKENLMAYAKLNSPLPGLTAALAGLRCCMGAQYTQRRVVMRGLGQDETDPVDTTDVDNFGDLTDPNDDVVPIIDPANTISPLSPGGISDMGTSLPLTASSATGPSLSSDYPATIGTEFSLVGANQYLNIQTGQIVDMATAQEVTAATTGAATATLQTTGVYAPTTGTQITDPTTGVTYTYSAATGQFSGSDGSAGGLSAAAQALQSVGQLVTAAGALTAQGEALAAAGGLVAPAPVAVATSPIPASGWLASMEAWLSSYSMLGSGLPDWGVLLGIGVVGMVATSYISSGSGKKKRR